MNQIPYFFIHRGRSLHHLHHALCNTDWHGSLHRSLNRHFSDVAIISPHTTIKSQQFKAWSTLNFLPSIAVISDSFPMVKELDLVVTGVFIVNLKSLPFCSITITGLTSFLIFTTMSGAPWRHIQRKMCYWCTHRWRNPSSKHPYLLLLRNPPGFPRDKPARCRWSPCLLLVLAAGGRLRFLLS